MNLFENTGFVIQFNIYSVDKFFVLFVPGIQRLFSDLIGERLISKTKHFCYFSVKLLFCMSDGKLQLCDPDHFSSSFAAQIPAAAPLDHAHCRL